MEFLTIVASQIHHLHRRTRVVISIVGYLWRECEIFSIQRDPNQIPSVGLPKA